MRDQAVSEWTEGQNGQVVPMLIGILCGAAIGAAIGLLFAPKSGAAMRQDLKRSAERLSKQAMKIYDHANKTVGELADRGVDVLERARGAAEDLTSHRRS